MSLTSIALRPLLPVDETRYASVAWEMWRTGNWLVPHLNGVAYDHKPPLLFWLIHLGWAAFGVSEWWPRLLAPLCTLLAMLALERLGNRLWPDRPAAGRIGTLVFLSSFYVAFYLTAVMFDMLLLACIAWGWVALHRAVTRCDWAAWLGFGLATGLGILAKGPVALVYLLPPLLLARWWRPLQQSRSPWYQPAIALVLAAAVPLAWLLAASDTGSMDYIAKLVLDQTVNRVNGEMGHPRPWYWYLPLLLLMPLPWSLWPPAWRSLKLVRGLWDDRASRFAIGTLVVGFVILSLVAGKQVHYLIPVFALGSLVIGRCMCEQHERLPTASLAKTGLLPVAVLMGGIGLLVTVLAMAGLVSLPDGIAGLPWWSTLLALAIATGLLVVGPRSNAGAVKGIAIASLAFSAITMAGIFSVIAPSYDLSGAAQYIARQQASGRDVAYVGNYQGEYTFLGRLQRPLVRLGYSDVAAWTRSHPAGLVVSRLKRIEGGSNLAIEFEQPYKTDRLLMYRRIHGVAKRDVSQPANASPAALAIAGPALPRIGIQPLPNAASTTQGTTRKHTRKPSAAMIASGIAITAAATGQVRSHAAAAEEQSEIASARAASFSAARAVGVAEQRTGGRAIKVGLGSEQGMPVWEVKTQAGTRLVDIYIDTRTGAVVGSDAEGVARAALPSERITLAAALGKAELEIRGRILEAERENEHGVIVYGIEVVTAAGVREVNIDAAQGRMMAGADADATAENRQHAEVDGIPAGTNGD